MAGNVTLRDRRRSCKTFLKLLAGYILLMALTACATGRVMGRPDIAAGELVRIIESDNSNVESVKGMALISLSSSRTNGTANNIVVAEKPSSFRIETLGLFGSMMVIAASGDDFGMVADNKFYTGRLVSQKMAAAPFPFNLLKTADITTVLLGGVPLIKSASSEAVYSDKESAYVLKLHSEDGVTRQSVWVDATTMKVVKSEMLDDGLGSTLTILFGGYRDVGGLTMPGEIDITIWPNPSSIKIRYQDIELNDQVDDNLFKLAPVEGMEVIKLQ